MAGYYVADVSGERNTDRIYRHRQTTHTIYTIAMITRLISIRKLKLNSQQSG